jgi:hypothetical protein
MPTYGEQADQIRRQHNARLEALRSRKDLSDEGRDRQIAKLKVETRDARRRLTKAKTDAIEQRKRRVEHQVFGTTGTLPSQITAQRNAMDRAAKIKTAAEADHELELARFTGDHGLAKAIAMRTYYDFVTGADPTFASEWINVLNKWAQDEPPSIDEALTELSGIHREQSTFARLARGMQAYVGDPVELRGKNVDRLAAEADGHPDEVEPDTSTGFETLRSRPTREQIFGTHYTPEAG